MELIPQLILRNAPASIPAYARQMGWVVGDPAAVLVVEFRGEPTRRRCERRFAVWVMC